jgi:peptide/nickel transport system substrate-binding protein
MDRQAVVDTITLGQSNVIDTYIPPEHPLYNFEMRHYDFDPEAGSALLEEVGWIDDDGDPATPRVAQGMTNVLDGTRLEVALGTGESPIGHQIATLTQGSLAQCGIQANLHFHLNSEWFADGPAGDLFGRRFDLALMAWYTGVEPPCDLYKSDLIPGPADGSMISIQTGEEVLFPSGWGGGQNDPGFVNNEYDDVCNAALQTLPGQPGYEEAHLEAQRIFAEELPVAPLFLRLKLAATRPDFCNFIMDPTANSEFWNVEEFDFGACAE